MKNLLLLLFLFPIIAKSQTGISGEQKDFYWINNQLRLLYDSVGNPISDSILMWNPATNTVKMVSAVRIYPNLKQVTAIGSHTPSTIHIDNNGSFTMIDMGRTNAKGFLNIRDTATSNELDFLPNSIAFFNGSSFNTTTIIAQNPSIARVQVLRNVSDTFAYGGDTTRAFASKYYVDSHSGGGSSTTIYNGDGSLAGRRNINGNGYSLFFNSNDSFGVSSSAIYFNNIGTYGSVFYGDSTGVSSIGDRLNTHNGFIFTIKDQNDQAYIADATYGNGLLNVNGGSTANVQIGDAGNDVNGTLLTVSDHSKVISTRFTKYSDGLFSLQNRSGVFYLGDGGGDINNTDFSGNDSLGTADISAPNGLTLDANIIANNVPSSDTTTAKPMGIDGSGNVYQLPYWPSGSGSSGTVTSVATGFGLTGGTITTSGTLVVDTGANKVATQYYVSQHSGGAPGGSTTQIQYNNGGAFAGSADLTWNSAGIFSIFGHGTGAYVDFVDYSGLPGWELGGYPNGEFLLQDKSTGGYPVQIFAGSNSGDFEMRSSGVSISHVLDIKNMYTTSTTPSISAGAGAGTGPTISIAGTNNDGVITLTAGTLPTALGTIGTITFSSSFAFPNGCSVVITPTTSTTGLTGAVVGATGATTGFTFNSVGLSSGTYSWNYHVGGY